MNNKDMFELIQKERDQLSILRKENEAEKANMYVIRLTDKEIPLSEMGIQDSRSITSQISKWKDTLSEEEKDFNFSFVGLENTILIFKDYLLSKYSGEKKSDLEIKYNNPDYENDVKLLFKSRIYQHKGKRSKEGVNLFLSGEAHSEYQFNEMKKEGRSFSHEAANRVVKIMNNKGMKSPLSDDDKIWARKEMETVFNESILNFLPDRKNESMEKLLKLQ